MPHANTLTTRVATDPPPVVPWQTSLMRALPPSLPIALRPAAPRDEAAAWQLKVDTLKPYIERTWGWNEAEQRRFSRRLFSPATIAMVVDAAGESIGMIQQRIEDGCRYLANVQVTPSWQNRGVGSWLVRATIALARQERRDVTLQVLRVNPAIALYRRLGFVETARTPTHIRLRCHRDASITAEPANANR